jgi:hypothetical protein
MQKAIQESDSVGFIGHFRVLQYLEEKQKSIISRNYEGSIVKAKPIVSGNVVTPWVNEESIRLVKDYKKHFTYGREFFPAQVIEDGSYYIKVDGKFLTDVNASPDRVGDFPVFVAEADTINPQRQLWNIELVPATGRYKITNAQDGRYINEIGTFWKDKNTKPFNEEWNTYIIVKTEGGYTIQCAGRAGSDFWSTDADRITNDKKGAVFQIEK